MILTLLTLAVLILIFLGSHFIKDSFAKDPFIIKAESYTKQKENNYLVYFYSDTCSPCKDFNNTLLQYKHNSGALTLYKVDVDKEDASYISSLHVNGTPTILQIKNGEEFWRMEGNMPLAALSDTYSVTIIKPNK